MNNGNYPIEIKTLTPVHTGSGHELMLNNNFIYYPEERCLIVLDIAKVYDKIGEKNMHQWLTAIDNKEDMLGFFKKMFNIKNPNDIAERIIPLDKEISRPAAISTFKTHNSIAHINRPIIAGSSLKGSIRTALLNHFIQNDDSDFASSHLGQERNGRFKYSDEQIQAHYFADGSSRMNPNKDIFKLLRVSDVEFEKTRIYKNNIINLFSDDWGIKHQQASYVECIQPNQSAVGKIQIPQDFIKTVKQAGYIRKNLDKLQIDELFKIANEHTCELLNYEINFWEDEDNPTAIGSYLDELVEVENTALACGADECVLRVGAGSGWDFMTGGWMKDDKTAFNKLKKHMRPKHPNNLLFPKTRKLLEGGLPLGFIKLKLIR